MTNKHKFKYEKAKEIHNDKYDYSLVEYGNIETKVVIVCPVHGKFQQTPYKHVNLGQGCGKCKGDRISKTKRFNIEQVVDRANEVHEFKYDYSKSEYKNMHTKTTILCKIHGEFWQNFNNHIFGKCGCPACGTGRNISESCSKWLDGLGILKEHREKIIRLSDSLYYKVDAYVPSTNIVYEYFGNFWHGNKDIYDQKEINPKVGVSYGSLYKKTMKKISDLKKYGYEVVFVWGD